MARKLERGDAYSLYTQEMKEISDISKMLNVSEKSIYRWKQDDLEGDPPKDWDRDRESFRQTPTANANKMLLAAVTRLNGLLEEIQKGEKFDSQEVYALVKLLERAEKMSQGQHNFAYILLFTKEFTEFCNEDDPETLQTLLPLLKRFGDAMAKKYRKK